MGRENRAQSTKTNKQIKQNNYYPSGFFFSLYQKTLKIKFDIFLN